MKIIGLDTTTHCFCIALVEEDRVLTRIVVDDKGFHSEEFLSHLKRILKENGLTKMEIDGYAISIGPGSLTGIRVGLAFLKGIGFATGKSVVPVETLFAIAYEFRGSIEYICPILITRRNKVFCALYRFNNIEKESTQRKSPVKSVGAGFSLRKSRLDEGFKKDRVDTITEQSCLEIKKLLDRLPDKNILFLGSGALKWKGEIISKCGEKAHFEIGMIDYPDPAVVAEIGLRKIKEGNVPLLDKLEPIYL